MEAGIRQFIESYAKDTGLDQVDVALLAGALMQKSIKNFDQYKHFILTLGTVAPQLVHMIQFAEKEIPND